MTVFYNLGIFTDFFNWLSETINTILRVFSNTLNGITGLYGFVAGLYGFMVEIVAWFPALIGGLITLGFTALIIKFIIAR